MSDGKVDRRTFLTHAAMGVAAVSPMRAHANAATNEPAGTTAPVDAPSGGDFMIDVMRKLGIDYVAATPGSTFMGLHESIINYGMTSDPKLTLITTMHEEASVAMAHGYAKIEGKPMACAMHATVGLQHGSMAIYNAWCDRVPLFMIVGASLDAARRQLWVDWYHAAQDGAALVRDFTKWDAQPGSLQAWGESAVRAYKFAVTPPCGPVLLATDSDMQEEPCPGGKPPAIPSLPRVVPPAGEFGAVDETAKLLVAADNPVIYVDRCARTPAGVDLLVQLAEMLNAPVCDSWNRLNFPWQHTLSQSDEQRALVAQADVLRQLEAADPFAVTAVRTPNGEIRSLMKAGSKRITISSLDTYMKSNYQDFQRYPQDIDLAIAADAEATLPTLIEAVRRHLPLSRRSLIEARGKHFAERKRAQLERLRREAAYGWDVSPISMPRLCQELYAQIKHEDWSLVSGSAFQSNWPQKLWKAERHYQYIGDSGGAGVGYTAPAALGAALANRKHGRLSVCINGDGDLMFGPGILWTAAHERIPLLYIIHNNRAYHMELMRLQAVTNRRQRGIDRARIGCSIDSPTIDYATVARGMGVYGEGPIERPQDLAPALRRAIAVVKRGEPALVDVVSQGR
jgi:thiamine pyrophosphate-dependent acetolactate synthase large subunit-like protein